MNKHREKCEHLKQIRKNMADSLGVDLKQTVCTYEGECSGTCPKCQQEEKVLSKALLAGTAVVASAAIMLTGCGNDYDHIVGGLEVVEPEVEIEEYELEGDVAYVGEEIEE